MAKYRYHIKLSRPIKAEEVDEFKGELLRLFQSTDQPEINGHDVTITTPMQPQEAGVVLDRVCVLHGSAWFGAGTRE